jgi:DNA-binding SARP family transcriptional activator
VEQVAVVLPRREHQASARLDDPRELGRRRLGPLGVTRNGVAVALPRSRKVRALLAYLALGQRPVSRSRLCRLLWDVPNDPRGELRWCLSKLRRGLDDGDRRRVITTAPDLIALDLSDGQVDALEIDRALQAGAGALSRDRLGELAGQFGGELLEATEIDGNPEFAGWLAATRQRYRAMHVAVLNELAVRARGSEEVFRHLDAWLQAAPFDQRAHAVLLDALVAGGRVRDAEGHLAAAIRSFEG